MAPGRVPPLHLVTADETLRRPDFAPLAEALLREGGPAVALHLRGRSTPARALLELARRLVPVADEAGGALLINDRVDVAMASGAHGVHLGGGGMPIPDARRLLGPRALLGASVHGPEEGRLAARAGADYLIAGTLFPTASHPGRAGSGTGWLRELAALGPPVVGIGGITPSRAREVRAAEGRGVAVLRGVWAAARPVDALAGYLEALKEDDVTEQTIRVQMNGEAREVPSGLSVQSLLEHLGLQPRMVVVERNGDILRRESYPDTGVAAGDTLELVHFVGGG